MSDDYINYLREGKVLLLESDTIWGFSCDATNENAVKKVFDIKKRDTNKRVIILVSDEDMLRKYSDYKFSFDLTKLEGVSFIIPVKPNTKLINKQVIMNNTICVRIPDSVFIKNLINNFGKPIISTSANESGRPVINKPDELNKEVLDQCSAIVYNPNNLHDDDTPSTVIDLTHDKPTIIRIGKNYDYAKRILKIDG